MNVVASRQRWVGVGHSADTDSGVAGRAAARQALESDDAKLIIVFCSERHDLPALLAGINEVSGGIPLVGCSTAGEIATNGPGEASVVVTAVGGNGFAVSTAVATDVASDLRGAGARAAECLGAVENRPHRVLMLLTDGLAGDQHEIVRGAYSVAGATVPLVGGCAGDDLKMHATFQFYNDQVLSNAVLGAAIASDSPMGIGVRHGWNKVGQSMLVTKSEGTRVYALDDEPALDVYLRRLNAPAAAHTDSRLFTEFALTHPLGLQRRNGEEVRFVGGANFEDRSLSCIAAVPSGAQTWFMEGDAHSVLGAVDDACEEALQPLGDRPPIGFVTFDCIARRGVLGDAGIRAEVLRIAERGHGCPVAGFYTYGEIARTSGVTGFHNQTLVVLALS